MPSETWCLTFIRSRSEPAMPPSRPLTFTMRYRAIFAEAFPFGFWNAPRAQRSLRSEAPGSPMQSVPAVPGTQHAGLHRSAAFGNAS
jgi:hypothetical protein